MRQTLVWKNSVSNRHWLNPVAPELPNSQGAQITGPCGKSKDVERAAHRLAPASQPSPV